jgi:tRNA splicing ligase
VRDYRTVIGSFVMKRNELDLDNEADSLINQVITLDIQASISKNLLAVMRGLNLAIPSSEELHVVLEQANNYQETITKEVRSRRKSKLPSFYGIKINQSFSEQLKEALKKVDQEEIFEKICQVKGASLGEWHMTIVYRGATGHELLIKFDEMFKKLEESPSENDSKQLLDKKVIMTSSNVIMKNDRVIALQIEKTEPEIQSINKYRHITLALLNSSAKAMESNALIQNYVEFRDSSESSQIESFPLKLEIEGEVSAYF